MPDLLPDDFGTETVQPPLLILREQAEHLGRKTGGLVTARVDTLPSRGKGKFIHTFVLEVPALEYAYTLFNVEHPILMYPLTFRSEFEGWMGETRVETQTAFEDVLRMVFSNPAVLKIITALKAQAMATVAPIASP